MVQDPRVLCTVMDVPVAAAHNNTSAGGPSPLLSQAFGPQAGAESAAGRAGPGWEHEGRLAVDSFKGGGGVAGEEEARDQVEYDPRLCKLQRNDPSNASQSRLRLSASSEIHL